MSNRKVFCAGCSQMNYSIHTTFYRNKRWCGSQKCKNVIDQKVKHSNYKKMQKKIKNGTFRHGVNPELREYIKERDKLKCRSCYYSDDIRQLQVHHIVPVSNGGTDDNENLILLCYECHKNVHNNGWENYVKEFITYTKQIHTQNCQLSSIKNAGVGI